MKLLDQAVDYLCEYTAVFDLVYARRYAKTQVTDLSPDILESILKILLLESPEHKRETFAELDQKIDQLEQVRYVYYGGAPTAQELYNWMIYDSSPCYNSGWAENCISRWKRKNPEQTIKDTPAWVLLPKVFGVILNITRDFEVQRYICINEYLDLD
jgi:hypothetical protein